MRPSVTILAAIAALATTAAPAAANTLSYSGTTGSSDAVLPGFIPTDANGPTSCGSTVNENDVGLSINPPFRQYAFRNLSSSSDCITVSGTSPGCPTAGEETGDVTFSGDLNHLLGSDDPNNINGCQVNHAHSFTAAAGQTFSELVFAGTTGVPFGLSVSGTNVAPAQMLVAFDSALPAGNTLSINTSSLEDGTGVEGTLTADAGPGHRYGGPIRCLRVSGRNASVVMTFDGTEQGLASKWKGAVYWLHQSADGTSDGQRNSLLTQQQLDGRYASCPDPNAPLNGSFNTITGSSQSVFVAGNGPQVTV